MGQKVKMIIAVIAAIAVGFLLLVVTYIISPNQKPGKLPNGTPVPLMLNQIFEAIIWIGVALSIAVLIIGAFFLINRIRPKKIESSLEIQFLHLTQFVFLLNSTF
jgi:magnesium-transporting ATPase (P-type)